jgi:hypothetical protein
MRTALWTVLLLAGFVGGCTSDDYVRTEGVTPGQHGHADGRSLEIRCPEHPASGAGQASGFRERCRWCESRLRAGTDDIIINDIGLMG